LGKCFIKYNNLSANQCPKELISQNEENAKKPTDLDQDKPQNQAAQS